jgi:hypothetical protein
MALARLLEIFRVRQHTLHLDALHLQGAVSQQDKLGRIKAKV